MVYYPNKRIIAITKSMLWFQTMNPDNIVLSNHFKLNWYTNHCGIIIHACQVGDIDPGTELYDKMKADLKDFLSFFRIFTFIAITSTACVLKMNATFKVKKYSPRQIIKLIQNSTQISDGFGIRIEDFVKGSNRHHGADFLNAHEVPNDHLRDALNALLEIPEY